MVKNISEEEPSERSFQKLVEKVANMELLRLHKPPEILVSSGQAPTIISSSTFPAEAA
jgi:hypothetical protein